LSFVLAITSAQHLPNIHQFFKKVFANTNESLQYLLLTAFDIEVYGKPTQ